MIVLAVLPGTLTTIFMVVFDLVTVGALVTSFAAAGFLSAIGTAFGTTVENKAKVLLGLSFGFTNATDLVPDLTKGLVPVEICPFDGALPTVGTFGLVTVTDGFDDEVLLVEVLFEELLLAGVELVFEMLVLA